MTGLRDVGSESAGVPARDVESGGPEQVFRPQALREYRESERLDAMLGLAHPRLWLALGVVLALIAAGVSWSFLGSERREVDGIGVLLPVPGLAEVSAVDTGVVTNVGVRAGDVVSRGQSVATLQRSDGSSVPVNSEVQGRVVFTTVEPGAFITPGTLVAQLLPTGQQRDATIFVAASDGKLIRAGMLARVSPSTAPAAQYGTIVGRVVSVSEVPLSQARLAQLIKSDVINAPLGSIGGPVLEVGIDLLESRRTKSGYAWTSGGGPPFPITPGTLLTGNVVLGSRRPIDHLLKPSGV